MHRFMPGTTTGDDAHLPFDGCIGTVDVVGFITDSDEVGMGDRESFQFFSNNIFGLIDKLFHDFLLVTFMSPLCFDGCFTHYARFHRFFARDEIIDPDTEKRSKSRSDEVDSQMSQIICTAKGNLQNGWSERAEGIEGYVGHRSEDEDVCRDS